MFFVTFKTGWSCILAKCKEVSEMELYISKVKRSVRGGRTERGRNMTPSCHDAVHTKEEEELESILLVTGKG